MSAKQSVRSGFLDEIVLSFHDSLLRRSDLELLQGCGWLNDRLIGFYFEYLERILFKDYAARVSFITPDVTQFVKLHEGGDAELEIFLGPLDLAGKDLILMAVNDNQSAEYAGGTHWSLLVYWRPGNVFEVYDSAPGTLVHATPATRLCSSKLVHFLRAAEKPSLRVMDCPKQVNSYDCGVYVMLFAEKVCQMKLQNKPTSLLSTAVTPESVTQHRTHTVSLIHSLVTS